MRSIWGKIIMNKRKSETDECPNCGKDLTYEGFVTFKGERIVSVVADWRCPECGNTGKIVTRGTDDSNEHW